MSKITVTMRALLEARQGADSIAIVGARQANAARALVALGLAREYLNQSKMTTGETYYNHFRRGYATRAPRVDIGGILYFNA